MSQESVLGLQAVAENALENGRWASDEPETVNGSSHGHEHDDIEEEDEQQMADGAETELELGDGEDATVKVTRKPGPPPMIDTELSGPSPTSVAADAGSTSPAGSTQSLPTVVEPHRPGTPAAQSAQAASFSQASLESARTQLSRRTNDTNNPPPSPSRRHLHTRSTPASEPTRSPNRLSGFFTNLIHRNIGPVPPSPLGSTQGERAATPAEDSANPSRSSSPAPPPRPATPPPSLPPPSLQELGLSLSVLTNDLSPSHFSTPPASGAFLAPHYLLLCHAQGLDVLPLVSPPAPQPYALIRRVPFKSVVVMEHRGVLVAIAGRRDGVRVYALDEVKKAVEWRLDVEIRRERDRQRREELKRGVPPRDSLDKRLEITATPSNTSNARMRRASSMIVPQRASGKKPKSHTTPPAPVPSRPVTPPTLAAPPSIPQIPNASRPPSYRSPSPPPSRPEPPQAPAISIGARRSSVTNVLGGVARTSRPSEDLTRTASEKAEWLEGSDEEEAINVMTAGPSGSQALDERTSAMAAASSPTMPTSALATPRPSVPTLSPAPSSTLTPTQGRRRPPDLQLDEAQRTLGRPAPPSPTPTLLTLQQALMGSPLPARGPLTRPTDGEPSDGDDDGDGTGSRTPTNDHLTFAEMLMESRIPDLPPPGTRVPQEAMMLTHSHALASGDDDSSAPGSPTASAQSIHTARSRASQDTQRSVGASTNANSRRRRRWSVLDGIFATSPTQAGSAPEQVASPIATDAPALPPPSPSLVPPQRPSTANSTNGGARERRTGVLQRAQSSRRPSSAGGRSTSASIGGRSTASGGGRSASVSAAVPPRPATSGGATGANSDVPPVPTPPTRFLSRLLGGAFNHSRRSEDSGGDGAAPEAHGKGERKAGSITAQQAPAPKLEYVKLPGTKGALLIKAVETNKKSFLAILCGDNGEKVELFAGTYRTALGLSRTFILPDSPRSLELQLQGDDLVEVFLVFAQNVFGLEPATVRVREVRIGRAERRAARRRARELRDAGGSPGEDGAQDDTTSAPLEETTTTTVSVSVGVAADANPSGAGTSNTTLPAAPTAGAAQDEMLAVAAAQMGPYTTFQQLPFSPHFPLAAIADEYVIPPTYPDFIEYRATHEPEDGASSQPPDMESTAFSPPGLPLPTPSGPTNWFYRDPKGNIHGPWNAGQMQTWYREGLLPLDLPVRREEDTEYVLLRDLRQQCIDPTYPFRSAPPARAIEAIGAPGLGPLPTLDPSKPLLQPLSLLTQSRIFGPPALFYSTRGGHSTVIVDGRGRSVLKGRFLWSRDTGLEDATLPLPPLPGSGRLGDVKRLEAFDIDSAHSVLVALRQGGFEAVDFEDALLRPADASRHLLPQFATTPSQINRREPFTWKIGMPVGTATSSATSLAPLKGPSRLLHAPVKKLSTGPGKSPAARSEFGSSAVPDGESEHTRDEVIFLGRRDDNVYICERNGGAFRILRLSPAAAAARAS